MSSFIAAQGFEGVTQQTLDQLNPLKIENSAAATELSTPEGVINRTLTFLFPIAGMALFVMLVAGGVEMMFGAAGKKSIDSGKQRVTAAIVGFILLFSAYWITQIVEVVFGIDILGA